VASSVFTGVLGLPTDCLNCDVIFDDLPANCVRDLPRDPVGGPCRVTLGTSPYPTAPILLQWADFAAVDGCLGAIPLKKSGLK
jgi:hypothetical protein